MGGKPSSLPPGGRPSSPAGVTPLQLAAKDATQVRAEDTAAIGSAKGAAPATNTTGAATARITTVQPAAAVASNLIPIVTAPPASAAAAAAAAAASPAAALVLSTGPSASRDSRQRFDALLTDRFPPAVRLVGLENYGATCYCNSVLQSLYNCTLFRRETLAWLDARTTAAGKRRAAASGKDLSTSSPLLFALATLFKSLSAHKSRSGVWGPKDFVSRMKSVAPQFQSTQHQDAQEFLIMLLNQCSDERRREMNDEAREEEAQQQATAAEAATKAAKSSKAKTAAGGTKTKSAAEDPAASNGKGLPSLSIPHPTGLASGPSNGFDSLPSMLAQVPLSPADPMLPPAFHPINGGAAAASVNPIQPPPLETAQPSILLQTILTMPSAAMQAASLTATDATAPTTPTDSPSTATAAAASASACPSAASPTFIQSVFEGTLLNLTSCLSCGRRSLRTEPFFDVSLEVLPDSSLSSLLRNFSKEEVLGCDEKYACSTCLVKQEAHKSMQIDALPHTLIVHLKRFRFQEQNQSMQKLTHRVTFPMHIRLKQGEHGNKTREGGPAAAAGASASCSSEDADKLYSLTSVVVHIGASLRHGHYVSLCKVANQWVCYDDDDVHLWTVDDVKTTYGSIHTGDKNGHMDGYLLFYDSSGDE